MSDVSGWGIIFDIAMYMAPALNGLVLIVLTALVTLYLRRLNTSTRRLAEAHEAVLMLVERHFSSQLAGHSSQRNTDGS